MCGVRINTAPIYESMGKMKKRRKGFDER